MPVKKSASIYPVKRRFSPYRAISFDNVAQIPLPSVHSSFGAHKHHFPIAYSVAYSCPIAEDSFDIDDESESEIDTISNPISPVASNSSSPQEIELSPSQEDDIQQVGESQWIWESKQRNSDGKVFLKDDFQRGELVKSLFQDVPPCLISSPSISVLYDDKVISRVIDTFMKPSSDFSESSSCPLSLVCCSKPEESQSSSDSTQIHSNSLDNSTCRMMSLAMASLSCSPYEIL
ncbi:hypothetical protein ADUPG1_013221 [Aduncisulcus paluster]|uniref:Uncharacterized protein n=1 Tax=Aduncisulcus paluster TaxID=2918883 RepID=A0ABQ5K268_9EUKA|nr:hypothetical protein ADUPG1_013221 [Aduncisulcus paluster]|eukprot:gnl/Carplike_NY0171/5405_a7381_284.p1 GENE.gnl/Carplike_NY0171/5405_a7381_284~~gnl/Carplike_NY0171/5405_a7381_284.p1  ORF type:complete len:233 (+),score=41.62 gnl/Carplike_NY0171/5405_a7381_284:93-791(+)